MKNSHFDGKHVLEHLKQARTRGQTASESIHGAEPSGHLIAGIDSARETSLYLFSLFILTTAIGVSLQKFFVISFLFSIFLLIWKTIRSALFGWARLERVHRLIAQEKHEIEHHRAEEKAELLELYKAKGFKDNQLQEVVEVLMADDNRLLQVMLEEELGLSLGYFEHPLKQCIGAFCGVILSSMITLSLTFLLNFKGMILASILMISFGAFFSARHLNNGKTKQIVWEIASSSLAIGTLYFLVETFSTLLKR